MTYALLFIATFATPVKPIKKVDNKPLIESRQKSLDFAVKKFRKSEPGSKEEEIAIELIDRLKSEYRPAISLNADDGALRFVNPDFSYRVIQVASRTECLVRVYAPGYESKGQTVWFVGIHGGASDGQFLRPEAILVSGTRSYTSVVGAKKTVSKWHAVEVAKLPPLKIPSDINRKRVPKGDLWHIKTLNGKRYSAVKFIRVRKGVCYFYQKSTNATLSIPIKSLEKRYQEWVREKLKR